MKRYATLTAGFFLTSSQQYHTSFMNAAVSQLHYNNDKCVFHSEQQQKIVNIIFAYRDVPWNSHSDVSMYGFAARNEMKSYHFPEPKLACAENRAA